MNTVIVIGGGAAGLTAAITAAAAGAKVLVLESGARFGKKILSTGNGRCNLTNRNFSAFCYKGSARMLAQSVTDRFGVRDTLTFFERIGIPTVTINSERDDNRYVYPRSKEAACVREALEMECRRLGVYLIADSKVNKVVKEDDGSFTVGIAQSEQEFTAERIILCGGGMAAPKTGSDGSCLELASDLGHRVISPVPALGPLETEENYGKRISGVRCEAKVTLFIDRRAKAEETGELQFTDYGLSGIPVFQLSGMASRALNSGMSVTVRVNLWPEQTSDKLFMLLAERRIRRPDAQSGQLLIGMLPDKLIPLLLEQSGIPLHVKCSELGKAQLLKLSTLIQNFNFTILRHRGFESAQCTSGGIIGDEISASMESLLIPGLFFAGEIVDVDGPCGGYNLQWAWSSGFIAGSSAAL